VIADILLEEALSIVTTNYWVRKLQASALTWFAVEARYPGDIEPITREELALAIEIAELRGHGSRYAKSREPAERAVQLEYPLIGRDALLGRYFNVDSNKYSNKKLETSKSLLIRMLQTYNSAILRRWLWVRAPPNPNISFDFKSPQSLSASYSAGGGPQFS